MAHPGLQGRGHALRDAQQCCLAQLHAQPHVHVSHDAAIITAILAQSSPDAQSWSALGLY